MFLRLLTKKPGRKAAPRPTVRPRLEELESRLTPSTFTGTYTNASVLINPNFAGLTVTETVTATVTPNGHFDPTTGKTTPPPTGATNPTTGQVFFNLNNQQQSVQVNNNGQATATFTMPLFTLLTSQTLWLAYQPTSNPPANATFNYGGSEFLAPLYTNYDNLFLAASLTFEQLTPEQAYGPFSLVTQGGITFPQRTGLPPFSSANGETNSFSLFSYHIVDPGKITSITAFGMTFPGSFANLLYAYGPQFANSNSGGTA